jgi:hypothetical protein
VVAEQQTTPGRDERGLAAARALISNRDIGRFAVFDEVGEGTIFPDGTEDVSGHVVAEDGRVFFFWTDWDAERGQPTLGTWQEVKGEIAGRGSGEYRQARATVGLA